MVGQTQVKVVSSITTSSSLSELKFEPSTSLNSSPSLSAGFDFFGGAMVEVTWTAGLEASMNQINTLSMSLGYQQL